MPQFTKTEQAILAVLADGKDHKRQEVIDAVRNCLNDPMVSLRNVKDHVKNTRRKLRTIGQDIKSINGIGIGYCHVRLLGSDSGEPRYSEDLD